MSAARFEDEGFKYHPDLRVSIQGQSASDAWKEVDRLAKKWRIPVTVEFWWRQNSKALYPGCSAPETCRVAAVRARMGREFFKEW